MNSSSDRLTVGGESGTVCRSVHSYADAKYGAQLTQQLTENLAT
jgi:hypothetical protein